MAADLLAGNQMAPPSDSGRKHSLGWLPDLPSDGAAVDLAEGRENAALEGYRAHFRDIENEPTGSETSPQWPG